MDESSEQFEKALARLSAGDTQARDELVQLSFQRLQRLASRMLSQFPAVRRWEETDDVLQQSAFRLWKALGEVKLESPRHFFNLAAVQVRRELIDMSRKFSGVEGHARNLDSVSPRSDDDTPAITEGHSDTYEGGRLASWTEFHDSVDQLDESLREVFQLIWYQGLSQQQVAALIDVPQRTISRRWQKARRELCHILGGQLPG